MYSMFTGQTADDVWSSALTKLSEKKDSSVSSRAGDTVELLHTFIHVENPTQRWVTRRLPPISICFALAELIWMLNGSDEASVINFWNPVLPKFAGSGNRYHGAYGYRIMYNFGINQLDRAYETLMNNPNSRQTVILIWDPRIDSPDEVGNPTSNDIPCNICSLIKIRDSKLEWTQIMRSNDLYLGLPYNFIQFTSLQEILAGWLRVEIGSYCHYSDSLHLYRRDINSIGIDDGVNIRNSDSLCATREETLDAVRQIFHNMTRLSSQALSETEMHKISNIDTGIRAYKNIMYMITAYVSDRSGYNNLTNFLVTECTNPLYVSIWNRWKSINRKGDGIHG